MNTDPGGADGRYPPIGDYGFLSDGRAVALVASSGSIDWCCLPRADHGSVFGRLLDRDGGGHCTLGPTGAAEVTRAYLDDTLVLSTRFTTAGGEVRLTEAFVTPRGGGDRDGTPELVRVLEGGRGEVECRLRVAPRFDYGGVRPLLRRRSNHEFSAVGGDDGLVVWCDAGLEADGDDLVCTVRVAAGERVRVSIRWLPPENIGAEAGDGSDGGDVDSRLDATVAWWRQWSAAGGEGDGPTGALVRRSAIVLKGLINDRTGAVMAAPTTSLPEVTGGDRNWDYRYSWIRDSQFAVRALGEVGRDEEAEAFRRFVERSAAGNAESLRVCYGLGGERRLTEVCLDHLEGYRGSSPVRIGNAAGGQRQLDVYGYLLDLAGRSHDRGTSPDDDYWRFLVSIVEAAADSWQEPDRGIWEIRGEPQHLVHSKVMCWVALDRGVRLAEQCGRRAPLRRWRRTRDAIRAAVEHDGYDRGRGVFVRAFGEHDVDAALLLFPTVGFVAFDDDRMVRTTDAVAHDLGSDGLVRRNTGDGSAAGEGVFLACAFWLAECYAGQDRHDEAQHTFDRAVATANDLGLFPEEFDPRSGELLGNFPQGLTHLSHIAAAVAMRRGRSAGAVGAH